jgi:hypothetical protein
VIASTVTVNTSPTLLIDSTENATRTVYIEPTGNDVHIGGSAVNTTTGLIADKDIITSILLPPLNALYAITGTGSVVVRILQPEGDY